MRIIGIYRIIITTLLEKRQE